MLLENQLLVEEWGEGEGPQDTPHPHPTAPRWGSELSSWLPPIALPSSLPAPICFLQFVKLVIIFLGAFLLFFKCKIYLYSVFKVVKKKTTKITTELSRVTPQRSVRCLIHGGRYAD